ncbi:RNA polymerase sigma-70 factor [Nocardioides sp. SR21]|uniref:RNA polymerase sigma-70 factor n=1 Tax=Nocardioides sp. SR21 TaxID=2919501 RepID=UPI001FAB1E69|nr:RNA polymerase sigma-70 factor [Nocardioides sp. SR21]
MNAVSTDVFVLHRNLLFTVAYEMLGSAADAEDVLQEAWLRWVDVDRVQVRDERAYLVRIVTRLSLNRMRTNARRRETYVGPWLPEPLLTTPDVAEDVELADSVSLAMLTVLETLGPTERAVFVLREVFAFEYDEIAAAVDKTPAAVRQIAHRARSHVAERKPRSETTATQYERVLKQFMHAASTGDVQGLMDVLAPDVVLVSDGGGVKKAALHPILGSDKVARFLAGASVDVPVTLEIAYVNGAPGIHILVDGNVETVVSAVLEDGLITGLYAVRNPEKLARVDTVVALSR